MARAALRRHAPWHSGEAGVRIKTKGGNGRDEERVGEESEKEREREREGEKGRGKKYKKRGARRDANVRVRPCTHSTVQARTHTARFSLVVYTLGLMRDDGPRRLLRHIE